MSLGRRSLQVGAFICTLIIGVASMAVIVTQTAWFKEWLRGFIVRQAEDYVNGRLSIGRLDGNLFFGVELEDVDVTMNGEKVVDIADVGVDYNAFTFLGGNIVLDDIRLNRPVLRLERTADGWNLAQLVKARTPDPDEPKSRRTIEIGEIGVSDGTIFIEGEPSAEGTTFPSRIERLDASVGVRSNADELTVDIAHVSLRTVEPAFGLNSLSGIVRRTENEVTIENLAIRTEESSLQASGTIGNIEGETPQVNVTASSEKLALGELASLVPALRGYTIQPAFEVTASGRADRLKVDLGLREERIGEVSGDLLVDAVAPGRRVSGRVALNRFNFGPLVPGRQPDDPAPVRPIGTAGAAPPTPPPSGGTPRLSSDITGEATIDLALPEGRRPMSGSYAVNAGHAEVAGYEVRDLVAEGRIDGQTIQVDARATAYGGRATVAGTVQTGDPLRLDLAGRAENVDLRNLPPELNVPAVPSDLRLDYTLAGRGGTFSGDVRLEESMLAGATIAGGTAAQFSVGAGAPQYSAQGQVAGLDLQQIGERFEITALANERYRSQLNASFDVKGAGGGRYPLTLDAAGTLTESTLFGASFPTMKFDVSLADGDITAQTQGQFANLDPAVVSGNERVQGTVTGAVDLETTIRDYEEGVTPESISIAGEVALEDSTVAGLSITGATIAGDYANREGTIDQLMVSGPDLNVTAQGPLALNDTGSSNVMLHFDSASLDEIGKIVGQPLKGAVDIDATLTGNAQNLTLQGTLKGSDLGHGDNEALSITSNFDVAVPDLTPADAVVKAKTMATFLEVGGQRITELESDVTFSGMTLEFAATASEQERQLEAGGTVIFHTDHQEIHLPRLALRSEGIEWRTPAGSDAAVQWAKERIEIEHLELVNADQRITADGTLGNETEPLQVTIENVDVAQIDQLFLGDQRLAGRFSADATIVGPTSSPRVEATFALNGGSFRDYTFESFGGEVDYTQQGVELDVRLQQSATEWFIAKGQAPLTLFRPNPEGIGNVHREPSPGDEVNIEITSSQIGLGVVQGFTSYVTDTTGALQANLKVTGSGYDPHINGTVSITGGSFKVPELGTSYTGLDTRVDLTSEGLTIQEFKILDDRGFPMTIGGNLALHARSVGAVDIKVQSEKFEVIDNRLADLKLNTDIRVTGEVRKPRVEGSIEVENGTIHVAELLEMVTADAYATEAAGLPAEDAEADGAAEGEAQPSVFDALEMNLGLVIPSNLVLRGEDIRAANAPIALGDMNITVAGQLELRKAPAEDLAIVGDVTTVRGSYTFQGRRFEILRDGRIGFSGSTEQIDPLLDLQARRVISGIEALIRVRGTMRNPELSFSSNPPLEEADILALIIFNQPLNQLGEGEQVSLAERAGALAGGYLTSGLSRSIGNALELDEFEIQATGEAGSGPSLTVGEQVGRNLFVRLRQGFGAQQTTELILEYQIADFLRAQASAAQGSAAAQRVQFRRIERAGLDLLFFFSY